MTGIKSRARGFAWQRGHFAAVVIALSLSVGSSGAAETEKVRIAIQYGMSYLPFLIMKHDKLIEKQAAAAGLGVITTEWPTMGGAAPINDALLSDNLDFGAMGPAPAIVAWAKTRKNVDIRGVAAFGDIPQYLVTTNPEVKSVKDFTDKDKIALPAVKVSIQAVQLQMAAAQAFGPDNFARLDRLTVSMSHPDAMTALLSQKSEITAHFSNVPFMNLELENPRVRKLLSSFDILGGPTSNGVVVGIARFRDKNPKTYRAFLAALDEAMAMIENDRKGVVQTYLKETKSKESVAFLLGILNSPDVVFTATPHNTMRYARFMYERGTIITLPQSWKDLFFPEIHDRNGS
jgi:sulfonate transport system substrate-binding protein